jgi:predicted nucleotidyltransferase component of viral defense system
MLNREKHQLIMGQILRDIYGDVEISSLLGFKGGTCAYLFYKLPRFSVDLDFDLLVVSDSNKKLVFAKITNILSKYGEVKDQIIKRYTVFALLSYGQDDHNIKVEINVRKLVENIEGHYEVKEYLGISMLVARQDYMFASKLAALTLRTELAMRDVYDIYYFAKNNWDINAEVIAERSGQTVKDYLTVCIAFIEKIKDNQVLQGLGELVDSEKEKSWIKNHLRADAVFMLKNYLSVIK